MSTALAPLPALSERDFDGEPVTAVDGREVHAFLGIGKDFTNWVKDQVRSLQLVENTDFMILAPEGEKAGPGRPQKIYVFTVDVAKHIGMASRTPKGHQLRHYFIGAEKALRSPRSLEERSLTLITELAGVVEEQKRLIASQAATLDEQVGPMLWFKEQESLTGTVATIFVFQDTDTPLRLNRGLWAALDGWCFYHPDGGTRRFTQRFVKAGYGINVISTAEANGHAVTRITPRWTAKGVPILKRWIREREEQGRIG